MRKYKQDLSKLPRYSTINREPSMVRAEFAEELEINNIMDRYTRTGYLPPSTVTAIFGDFSMPQDFDTLQDKLIKAKESFIQLPIEIRDTYRTAESLIKAISDPFEKERLTALGVFEKPQAPAMEPVPAVGDSETPVKKQKAGTPAAS